MTRILFTVTAGLIVLLLWASLPASSTGAQQLRGRPGFHVRWDSVRSRHLLDGTIGAADLGTTLHVINVAAAATSGTSAADPASVGGKIVGVRAAGNQDQFVDNVVLNANGSVTVTLAAAATAINNIRVIVAHGVPRQ
jgi:hypothetical protein